MDYLEERAPNSNSHKDTHCMGWQGEALRVSPGSLCLLAVGLLKNVDVWSHLGLLTSSLLLSILTLKLSEAASVGSFLIHTYCTRLAKVLQKPLGGQF